MTDILDEVLNTNNEEKKLYYFRKFLPMIIIITLVIILIMMINNWYDSKRINNNKADGDILVKAISLTDNKDLTINSLVYLIQTSNNKIKELAAIEQINLEIKQNNVLQANILLKKIIDNKKYGEITSAYARLIWLSLNIEKLDLSKVNIKEIEEYLNYFDNPNKPFYGTANIIKSHWYIKNVSNNLAKITLKNLLSLKDITSGVKEQAEALLSTLK